MASAIPESRLGQNRCVKGVEAGSMGGSLWRDGDVMNRSAEAVCISGFVVDGRTDMVTRNEQIDIQER